MDDNRSYIEQTQARAVLFDGREHSPEEMARNFAKLPLGERAEILDELDRRKQLRSDEPLSARESAQRLVSHDRYVDALRNVHHTLRRIDR
jgi:hypothetical protein